MTEYICDNEPPPSQSSELGGDSNSVDSEVGHMIIHGNPISPADSNDSIEPPPFESIEVGGDSNSVNSEVGQMIFHENPTSPGDSMILMKFMMILYRI